MAEIRIPVDTSLPLKASCFAARPVHRITNRAQTERRECAVVGFSSARAFADDEPVLIKAAVCRYDLSNRVIAQISGAIGKDNVVANTLSTRILVSGSGSVQASAVVIEIDDVREGAAMYFSNGARIIATAARLSTNPATVRAPRNCRAAAAMSSRPSTCCLPAVAKGRRVLPMHTFIGQNCGEASIFHRNCEVDNFSQSRIHHPDPMRMFATKPYSRRVRNHGARRTCAPFTAWLACAIPSQERTVSQLHTTQFLLARIQGGDLSARRILVARIEPLLQRFARGRLPKLLRHEQDTADLMQLTWLKVLEKLDSIAVQRPGDFFAYLRTVLLNALREALRRHDRSPISPQADVLLSADSIVADNVPLDDWLAYEQALATLPGDDRVLVIMRFEFGMRFVEMAEELGESPDAIRMRVTRALARVAEGYRDTD